jgi:hypothetical protein
MVQISPDCPSSLNSIIESPGKWLRSLNRHRAGRFSAVEAALDANLDHELKEVAGLNQYFAANSAGEC